MFFSSFEWPQNGQRSAMRIPGTKKKKESIACFHRKTKKDWFNVVSVCKASWTTVFFAIFHFIFVDVHIRRHRSFVILNIINHCFNGWIHFLCLLIIEYFSIHWLDYPWCNLLKICKRASRCSFNKPITKIQNAGIVIR